MDKSTNKSVEERARRLREVLERLGVTQAEFARNVGVTQAFVSAVAVEKSQASIQMIAGMRESYGVSPDWFILGNGDMFAEPPPVRAPPPPTPDKHVHELVDRLAGNREVLERVRAYLEGVVQEAAPKSRKRA